VPRTLVRGYLLSENKQISIKDIKELLAVSNQINILFTAEKSLTKLLEGTARRLSECCLFSFGLINLEDNAYGCCQGTASDIRRLTAMPGFRAISGVDNVKKSRMDRIIN